jgi:hypothetical protein
VVYNKARGSVKRNGITPSAVTDGKARESERLNQADLTIGQALYVTQFLEEQCTALK